MAHLITGYAGYAHIKSSDEGAFNASFFGGGQYVMDFGNCFEGSILDNNTVRILDGDGLMYGRHFRIEPNTYEDMTIETGTAGTNRIDLICMTYKKDANDETETAYLEVIKGTETAGTPSVPEYTDGNILEGATLNQMPLYKVTLEGVVLKKIEPMFELIPSYKSLAKIYAERYEATCDELKETFGLNNVVKKSDIEQEESSSTDKVPSSNYFKSKIAEVISMFANKIGYGDVVDNLLSTATNLPASANQARVLDEKKLDNDYRNDSNVGKGIIFGNNADGTHFTMRPILGQSVLQFTVNDSIGILNLFSDGRMTTGKHFSAPNIDAMQTEVNRMNEQKYYEIGGMILNGASGYIVTGHGMATITILPNKIARIDYTVKVTKNGKIVGCYWGINSQLLRYMNSNIPNITPLNGGTVTIYNADGTINADLSGYGASHIKMNEFWNFGRSYQINADNSHLIDYGQWEETAFTEGMRVVGTCYGTVE